MLSFKKIIRANFNLKKKFITFFTIKKKEIMQLRKKKNLHRWKKQSLHLRFPG